MFGDSDSGGTKSFIMQKAGPMPVWAWGLAGLGVAVAYASWKKNKATATAATASGDPQLIGGDQEPPVVFQNYTTVVNPLQPPGAGRTFPPVHAPIPPPGQPILHTGDPGPVTVLPPAGTPAPPAHSGTPAPAQPAGSWVTVAKYTSNNPPWNSTLWGIAKHFGLGSSSTNYASIWNAPQNSALKARRKTPTSIQPGDSVFVPAK